MINHEMRDLTSPYASLMNDNNISLNNYPVMYQFLGQLSLLSIMQPVNIQIILKQLTINIFKHVSFLTKIICLQITVSKMTFFNFLTLINRKELVLKKLL